jgi:hypothetical protein
VETAIERPAERQLRRSQGDVPHDPAGAERMEPEEARSPRFRSAGRAQRHGLDFLISRIIETAHSEADAADDPPPS